MVCFTHPVKSKTALSVFINLPPRSPLFLPVTALCGKECVCVSVLSLPNGTCATGRLHNIARFFCLCLVDVYLPFSPVFCRVARSVYSFLAKSETDIEDYIYYIGFPGEK